MVGRPRGAAPDMARWMSDSAWTVSPLQISIWCTFPTKKRVLCSTLSMTMGSELGAEWESKVGWKGQVGGLAETASGASAKGAWEAPPSHNSSLPTSHFPTHNTWSTLGQSQLDKSPATAGSSGGGVQERGVGLLVAMLGFGGPQVKKSPLQPILGVGEGRHPMLAASGPHQQHIPPLQLNGVSLHHRRIPEGRPRLHRHLVVLSQAAKATQVTPRDFRVVGGGHLGVGGDITVGELCPTPHTRHDDAARRHWVEVPNLRDTFHVGGWSFLKRGPPDPLPQGAFGLPTPREMPIRCLIFTLPGVQQ